MTFANFHTHTEFCDGRDAPEELVLEAIRLGCPEIGFSGHGYAAYDTDCCMSPKGVQQYRSEVKRLREKYAGKIKIWLGLERDFFSPELSEDYDYVIGSVHYLYKDGKYLCVDMSRESFVAMVEEHFGGDFYAAAESYYANVAEVYKKTGCDIIGHFDLITKFNEGGELFDTSSPRYRKAALEALEALAETPAVFELNTGAVAKGYRSASYPEDFIVRELLSRGKKLVLSSDCHAREKLLFGFEEETARWGEKNFFHTLAEVKRQTANT